MTHFISLALDRLVCCYCFLHDLYMFLWLRLCNSRLPEEHFVCYQTSQRKWVIIKVLYRCLQRYLLGWRISRLGFVAPTVGEVYLGPLGNAHHLSLASIVTNELVTKWSITERVKRLAGNEIELGIGYRRSNLGQVTYRWQREQRMLLCGLTDKDLRRICRNNMNIHVPLLVIDQKQF